MSEKLKTILQKYPLVRKDIEIKTVAGPVNISAITSGTFAVHQAIDNETYNITDSISGMTIVSGYNDIRAAILGIQMVLYTLDNLPNPFESKNPVKNKTGKAIAKFLFQHRKVWNNVELENAVGVFYRDRAECERLRHKINPALPIEYLDEHAHDNRMIADLLLK